MKETTNKYQTLDLSDLIETCSDLLNIISTHYKETAQLVAINPTPPIVTFRWHVFERTFKLRF